MRRRINFEQAFKAFLGIKEEEKFIEEESDIQNECITINPELYESELEMLEEDKTEEVNIGCTDLDDAWLRIKTILQTTKATRKRITQMNREWKSSGNLA